MKAFLALIALIAALVAAPSLSTPAKAQEQPCQWNYGFVNGVATATYCGNVQANGSFILPDVNYIFTPSQTASENIANFSLYSNGNPICPFSGGPSWCAQTGYAVENFVSSINVVDTATTKQGNAVSGYCTNDSTITSPYGGGCVAFYGSAMSLANGAPVWGMNTITTFDPSLDPNQVHMTGIEVDLGNTSGTDFDPACVNTHPNCLYAGINIFNSGTNRGGSGLIVQGSTVDHNEWALGELIEGYWQSGIQISSGASGSVAMLIIPPDDGANPELRGKTSTLSADAWIINNNGDAFFANANAANHFIPSTTGAGSFGLSDSAAGMQVFETGSTGGHQITFVIGNNPEVTITATGMQNVGLYQGPLTTWTATQTCTAGQIAWDANFIYVCTATNTVKRAALSTF